MACNIVLHCFVLLCIKAFCISGCLVSYRKNMLCSVKFEPHFYLHSSDKKEPRSLKYAWLSVVFRGIMLSVYESYVEMKSAGVCTR